MGFRDQQVIPVGSGKSECWLLGQLGLESGRWGLYYKTLQIRKIRIRNYGKKIRKKIKIRSYELLPKQYYK